MRPNTRLTFLLTGILVLSCGAVVKAETLSPVSRVTDVTVYPGSAHLTRKADVNLKAGDHTVVFENIIPMIDENSLVVSGEGQAAVKIYGAYLKKEFVTEEVDQRAQELQDQIQKVDDQIQAADKENQVLDKEKEFLNSINLFAAKQIPQDLVTKMPAVADLDGLLQFISTRHVDIEKKREECRLRLRALNEELLRLRRTLAEMRGSGRKEKRSIVVDLGCSKPGTLTLAVSFLIRGADWRPIYDARADFEKEEVDLAAYAMIRQSTGEDWENVKLTLSTARPTVGGRMPYVDPWILRPYQPVPRRALMAIGGASDEAALQVEAYSPTMAREDKKAMPMEAEVAQAQVVSKGLSVVYQIAQPATVKADGSEYKFPVVTQKLKADFEYSTFPRATALAYLGSRVKNSDELHLLAGQVNLFLDGDFIGKSSIDNIGPGEEFDLYLGVDDNVKVERKQISRQMDDVLMAGIPSPNRKTTIKYRLKVENYKRKKIKVKLFEATPVSENDRVKVKVSEVSENPQTKDWKDRKGIWLWEFALDPQKNKEIFYSFSVEHPRDMNIPDL